MQEKVYYLHKITNLVNGKLYIGMTKDPIARKRQHLTKKNVNSLVCKAVKKYGKESFSFDVICVGSKEYISDLEEKAINLYGSNVSMGGYNIALGGFGGSLPRRGKVTSRKSDIYIYAAGFWFPNKRTVLTALNWTSSKYRYRVSTKTLGDVVNENLTGYRNKILDEPCYYKGFWFSNISKACEVYSIHTENIKKEIKDRRFEENCEIQNYSLTKMFYVNGVAYKTLEIAAQANGISKKALQGRYTRKKDPENYSFTYIKEVH